MSNFTLKEIIFDPKLHLISASASTSTSTSATSTTTCSPVFASTSGLMVYFPMDASPSYLSDTSGLLTATAASVTSASGERNESVLFLGSIGSYFQINNLVSLGTANAPFSIAVYIRPNVLSGTIVHISKYKNGMETHTEK